MTFVLRRPLAAFAAVAALAAGTTTLTIAAEDASGQQVGSQGLLDDLLGPITGPLTTLLDNIVGMPLATLQAQLAPLTSGEIAQLIGNSDSAQLTALLAALEPTQLSGALATLDGAELATLVGGVTSGNLAGLLAGIAPEQLTGLLTGGLAGSDLVDLLAALTTSGDLTGAVLATIGEVEFDALVAQLTGGQLNLLVAALLAPEGLGGLLPADLTKLLNTVTGLVLPSGADASAVDQLITRLTDTLGGGTGVPAPGDGTGTPPGGGTATPAKPAPAVAAAPFTRFRATIRSVRIAKSRRTAKVRVSCPASAPVGCLVRLDGRVARRSAITVHWALLRSGEALTAVVRLKKVATRRLRRKGGALRISATTVASTLGTAARSAKVKKPKKRKRGARKRRR